MHRIYGGQNWILVDQTSKLHSETIMYTTFVTSFSIDFILKIWNEDFIHWT